MVENGSGERLPRLVGWLLLLCPAGFRREYGADLEDVLRRRAADARRAGDAGCGFWVRECAGLIGCGVREWATALSDRLSGRSELVPSTRRGLLLDQVLRELRQAFRRLLNTPVFGVAAVLTLALALGANAAIFTLVRRVVLYPFPYRDADRLVLLEHTAPEIPQARGIGTTINLFLEYRERSSALDDVALFQNGGAAVRVNSVAERVPYTRSTPNLASVLGSTPQLGRWLVDSDAVFGSIRVVVLSQSFWQRAYGGDPAVLGQRILVNGIPLEIVGVMPAEFRFPRNDTELWLPYAMAPQGRRDRGFNYEAVGRLRTNVTMAELRTDLSAAIERHDARLKSEGTYVQQMHAIATPQSLRDNTVGTVSRALWILFAAVGMVLLIACANVANLFLVRMESRQRDLAVRRALGAGRRGVLLYFLSESILLGLIAGAMGFLIALAGVRLLVRLGPADLPRLDLVRVDGVVALFTLGVALLSGLLLGALPLLRSSNSVANVLHESSRGNTAGRNQRRGRSVLATVQIALALVLLVAAGLVLRSYDRLQHKPMGFQTDQRLMFRITLSESEYGGLTPALLAQQQLLARVRTLPGVVEASATTCFPLDICWGADIFVEGRNQLPDQESPVIWHRRIAPDYFRTMGTRMVRGRDFASLDFEQRTGAVIINQALADLYMPSQNPIGRRLYTTGSAPDSAWKWLSVVGVVENMIGAARTEAEPMPQIYVPLPTPAPNTPSAHSMVYVVRASGAPLNLLPSIRRVVSELSPNLPVTAAETVRARVQRASAQMAFTMTLLLIAATVALLLGIIGVYAVISYSVSQRSTEVGVRIALGATQGQVVGMILREGGLVIGAGVLLGLLSTLASTRVLGTLLFGVSHVDPLTYSAVSVTLVGCALLACYIPARRAARLDPGLAMRTR